MNDSALITYQDLLGELKKSTANHLLLGNGFNSSLGIKTDYSEIFSRMKQNYDRYRKTEKIIEDNNYDIEKLIGHLKEQTECPFLKEFIETKVKLDFMKATNEIVQESIRGVYREKNQEIFLFFKNFTNYFTLNYDPFLYLLLLQFKRGEGTNDVLVLQKTMSFIENDFNSAHNNMYTKITTARKEGELQTTVGDESVHINFSTVSKTDFRSLIKRHFKGERWKSKDVDKVCDKIWEEEKREGENRQEIFLNDGFSHEDFNNSPKQNLFFLHGAFHIYEKSMGSKKITQKQNKAFCKKLEELVQGEEEEIILILASSKEDKIQYINENSYLKNCFGKLSTLNGSLVILGSSLAENDEHIFEQINNSPIKNIYISSSEDKRKDDYKKAIKLFENKNIALFNYKTISYNNKSE